MISQSLHLTGQKEREQKPRDGFFSIPKTLCETRETTWKALYFYSKMPNRCTFLDPCPNKLTDCESINACCLKETLKSKHCLSLMVSRRLTAKAVENHLST